VSEATDDARDALTRDVNAAMQPYESNEGLAFPIAAHLATGDA
jgi:hypothetical protein